MQQIQEKVFSSLNISKNQLITEISIILAKQELSTRVKIEEDCHFSTKEIINIKYDTIRS
ncbi:MAG: hypothetical protein KAH84_01530 [Thiomargarita sp.]|nr:hypothetical protein [Thiomargarita sp.]